MKTRKLLIGAVLVGLLALGMGLGQGWRLTLAHGGEEETGEAIQVEILMGEFFFQVEGRPQDG